MLQDYMRRDEPWLDRVNSQLPGSWQIESYYTEMEGHSDLPFTRMILQLRCIHYNGTIEREQLVLNLKANIRNADYEAFILQAICDKLIHSRIKDRPFDYDTKEGLVIKEIKKEVKKTYKVKTKEIKIENKLLLLLNGNN